MRILLKDRGMRLLAFCPICGLKNESTEHALLRSSRVKLVWRMVGNQSCAVSTGPWLGPFLDAIRHSSDEAGGRMVYIAYQIWLSKNNIIFEAEVILVHWVLQRAICRAWSSTIMMLLVLPLILRISRIPLIPRQ